MMTSEEAIELLKTDVKAWNRARWGGEAIPDLSGADLSVADLSNANLGYADLSGANLNAANLMKNPVATPH